MQKISFLNSLAKEYLKENKNLRKGQALFNALQSYDSKTANEITGTENDCFYDDSKIPNFKKAVKEIWGKPNFTWNEAIQKLYLKK